MTHTHTHTDEHSHEDNSHAGQGMVVLDIGGDVGALVVTMPESMLGEEVEVLTGQEEPGHHRPHVAVVPRPVPGGAVPSLVFSELVEGATRWSRRAPTTSTCAWTCAGERSPWPPGPRRWLRSSR